MCINALVGHGIGQKKIFTPWTRGRLTLYIKRRPALYHPYTLLQLSSEAYNLPLSKLLRTIKNLAAGDCQATIRVVLPHK